MPADGDAGLVDVAEWLAVAGFDDLGDVDVVVVGVAGQFVGEPDVDVAVGGFGEFGEFGGFAAAEIPDPVRFGQVVAAGRIAAPIRRSSTASLVLASSMPPTSFG